MKKKQMYQLLAGAVGVCFMVSLISTVTAAAEAVKAGGAFPISMVAITLVTGFCTVMIWKSTKNVDD